MSSREYSIEWKRAANKELRQLPREVILRILRTVEGLRTTPFPSGVRKLAGAEDKYRIREGTYRIIYTVHDDRLVVEVLRVGHRKDVYR